jgi:hypothetical protein
MDLLIPYRKKTFLSLKCDNCKELVDCIYFKINGIYDIDLPEENYGRIYTINSNSAIGLMSCKNTECEDVIKRSIEYFDT